jgi:hypothetical protein
MYAPAVKLTCAALLLTIACAAPVASPPADDAQMPASNADIRGTVTSVRDGKIMVEEKPGESSAGAKAMVTLTSTTTIRRAGRAATASDIRAGDRVSVWFDGKVMQSFPLQGKAVRVEVE